MIKPEFSFFKMQRKFLFIIYSHRLGKPLFDSFFSRFGSVDISKQTFKYFAAMIGLVMLLQSDIYQSMKNSGNQSMLIRSRFSG